MARVYVSLLVNFAKMPYIRLIRISTFFYHFFVNDFVKQTKKTKEGPPKYSVLGILDKLPENWFARRQPPNASLIKNALFITWRRTSISECLTNQIRSWYTSFKFGVREYLSNSVWQWQFNNLPFSVNSQQQVSIHGVSYGPHFLLAIFSSWTALDELNLCHLRRIFQNVNN